MGGLQLVLSETIRIGDTQYNIQCSSMPIPGSFVDPWLHEEYLLIGKYLLFMKLIAISKIFSSYS
jgi:hypothetical protein